MVILIIFIIISITTTIIVIIIVTIIIVTVIILVIIIDRATEIKNQINKTFAAVLDANAVLQVPQPPIIEVGCSFLFRQVLADDDTKCQLNQEVEDLREAIKVLSYYNM